MSGLSEDARRQLVHRLDPDGHLRDLIDVALRRYDQRRHATDGEPQPTEERQTDGRNQP